MATPNTIMHTGATSSSTDGTLSTMANVYVVAKMLIRALPYLVFEKFGRPRARRPLSSVALNLLMPRRRN